MNKAQYQHPQSHTNTKNKHKRINDHDIIALCEGGKSDDFTGSLLISFHSSTDVTALV